MKMAGNFSFVLLRTRLIDAHLFTYSLTMAQEEKLAAGQSPKLKLVIFQSPRH